MHSQQVLNLRQQHNMFMFGQAQYPLILRRYSSATVISGNTKHVCEAPQQSPHASLVQESAVLEGPPSHNQLHLLPVQLPSGLHHIALSLIHI